MIGCVGGVWTVVVIAANAEVNKTVVANKPFFILLIFR
jgi:hypothetical protein